MISISQQQYNVIVHRINQLQAAQDYNQQIINQLTQKLDSLEQQYLATQTPIHLKTEFTDSEYELSMS